MTRRNRTRPSSTAVRFVAALALTVATQLPGAAASTSDPKICAQITAISTLNKSAETARFEAGANSEKDFLATLQRSTAGLVSAHTALAKLVTTKQRPGVNYALARVKKLQNKLAKAKPSTVLSVFGPWTTEDVANFDVLDTKAAYLATMTSLAGACGAKIRVFLI
jgi:hypothetical protein